MDYRTFAQRLQETLSTAEVPVTSAMIAYLYKISPEQASALLQQAAQDGLVKKDPNAVGILAYVAPKSAPVFETIPPTPETTTSFSSQTAAFVPPLLIQEDPILGTSTVPPTEKSLPAEEGELPQRESSQYTRCPFCHESILIGSRKCRYCLEYLDPSLRSIYNRNRSASGTSTTSLVRSNPKPTTLAPANATGTQAALLSFFMPGLGQMTTGQIAAGVLWMVFTCFGYAYYLIPGLILHALCVINAYKEAQTQQPKENKP